MNIWVIATLDTKYAEAALIKERIDAVGHTPIVVDPGSHGIPGIKADITREEVALAGGESYGSLLKRNEKAHSQGVMQDGLSTIITREYAAGKIDAVIAVGGGQGTATFNIQRRRTPSPNPRTSHSSGRHP